MIEPGHPRVSVVRQCELASISRSSFYREPTSESVSTLRLMRLIDEQFLDGGALAPWARRTMRLDFVLHHLGLALGGRPAAKYCKPNDTP